MFYSITGEIVFKGENMIAVNCNGVAFRLTVSANTLASCSEGDIKQTFYTFLSVREDAMELFGFSQKAELDCFKLLTSISGVGPKAAVSILSALTPDRLALAVSGDDIKSITAAQGIGPKIAQRIILELKGKLDSIPFSTKAASDIASIKKSSVSYAGEDAVNALVMLGYTKSEAGIAVGRLDSNLTTEQMIKLALKDLARNL
ncbi:MAG: Holliday junction branch migration protein RuvA [Clostridiales bacterium]|nr:Holliday junction branch migration protein RuvA [Clostridiales bacterium]